LDNSKYNYTKKLGHITWKFLYTLADGFQPDKNITKINEMKKFLYMLSKIYTCNKCQKGFFNYVSKNPPITCCNNHFKKYIKNMELYFKK
jgi:hypothetical protein